MIKSMTGYGRGDCILYNRKFTVEIKSVNHRFNDLSIKLPRVLNSFEDKIKAELSKVVNRGKTDVYVHFESFSADDIKVNLNEALADSYFSALSRLKLKYPEIRDDLSLSLIARFPDIVTVEKLADSQDDSMNQMWEALFTALKTAIDAFIKMREIEGAALKSDLLKKKEVLAALTENVKTRAPHVAQDYAVRLKTKIEEALANVNYDETRLIQEITIFSDKSCIDEELIRLSSHLSQLSEILCESDAVGKKLDFLVQEINREVNTIGSKSNDLEITKLVVQMKSEVEKIREQVQNIE